MGIVRLHASNVLRITKRLMCNDISEGGRRISVIVKNAFEFGMDELRACLPMQQSSKEILYYIAGWLLRAAIKAAKLREKNVREQLNFLVAKSSCTREEAVGTTTLPTAKVEKVELFGGLHFANEDFFTFVERLEYVFVNTLTPELLVMNGSCVIDLVYNTLNTEESVLSMIASFCEIKVSIETVSAVTTYITRAYCRMRGKDFARRLMARDTYSLKQTRRPTLAAMSDPATYKAKRQGKAKVADLVEDDKEVEFLLFDTVTGNISTEDKASVDDDNLLEH